MEWSIDRLIDETQRLAARGLPRAEFFSELAPRLRNVIDNDASCWHTLDPHPRMLTSDAPDGLIDRGIYAPREAAAAGELIVRNPPLVSTDVLRGLPWRRCPGYGPFIVPELAEAAARTGDVAVLASAHRWVKKRTCVTPTDWSLGVEARIPALQSHGPDADAFYRQSVEHLRRTPRPDRTGAHSSALWRVAATPAPPSRCSRAGVCETRHRLAQGASARRCPRTTSLTPSSSLPVRRQRVPTGCGRRAGGVTRLQHRTEPVVPSPTRSLYRVAHRRDVPSSQVGWSRVG